MADSQIKNSNNADNQKPLASVLVIGSDPNLVQTILPVFAKRQIASTIAQTTTKAQKSLDNSSFDLIFIAHKTNNTAPATCITGNTNLGFTFVAIHRHDVIIPKAAITKPNHTTGTQNLSKR